MANRQFDAEVLQLRFSEEHCDDLPHLLRLALMFGRYRVVKRLRHLLSDEDYGSFLREQALPQVPISGNARDGFAVDEAIIAEIAAELGEPVPALLSTTVHKMLLEGSRHIAKLYVLARLSGDATLVRGLQEAFDARARHPRRDLPAAVKWRFPVDVVQTGDDDDYNPKSAYLFAGGDLVIKEHLRLRLEPSGIGRYSQERELLDELRHPRIVELIDIAAVQHHELLLLQRVNGETLDGTRHSQARLITRQLAEVLAFLHARNILYLDVKPKNVLFDGRNITLCDFGMARRGVMVGSMLSTLEYVPPEMAREFTSTPESDIFQLGILFHQLRTGRHPFSEGVGFEVALANLWDEPKIEPDLPEVERVLLLAMLAKDPSARPGAAEVAARLS